MVTSGTRQGLFTGGWRREFKACSAPVPIASPVCRWAWPWAEEFAGYAGALAVKTGQGQRAVAHKCTETGNVASQARSLCDVAWSSCVAVSVRASSYSAFPHFFGAFAKCTSPGKRCWFSRFLQTRTVCGTDSFISVIYTTALGAVWSKSTALLMPQGRLKSRRRQNTGACHSREGWGSSTGSQMGEKELCFLSEQNLSSSIIFLHASLLYMRMGCSRCPCWAAAFQPAGCTLLCCSRRAAGPHAQLTAGRDCCPLLLLGCVFVTDSLISAASGTWCISGTYRSISSLLAQTFLLLLNNA